MSIVDFMEKNRLKNEFETIFTMPKFEYKKEIIAPPLSNNYSLVGIAFDYLFRFYMARNNKFIGRPWVSETTIDIISYMPDLKETMLEIIDDAKIKYKKYLKDGKLTDDLLISILKMAKLDQIKRSGGVFPLSFNFDKEDLDDLKNLYMIIPNNIFKTKDLCFLNPTFGSASLLVGGSDADLIVGSMLIDIKTTKELKFTKKYLMQLVGYYILSQIGGVDGAQKRIDINRLGIYYSRYGYLFYFSITDIVSFDDIEKFKELFIDSAQGFC